MRLPLTKHFTTVLKTSLLFLIPQGVLADEARYLVSNALERAYEGSRYDELEASIDHCVVRFHRRDSSACSQGASVQTLTYFVDLRRHSAHYFEHRAKEVDDEWRFRIELTPKGEWLETAKAIDRDQARILNSMRDELDWGRHAAIAANEEFRSKYDVDSFHSLTTAGYCPVGQTQRVVLDRISLQGENVEELVSAFKELMKECEDS